MGREPAQITPPSGLRVNRQSAVPVHAQLTTQIRHLIDTAGLKPGVQLPTVRQLAGFLRINRNTAARALADLHTDGYLESRPGRGTFVVEGAPPGGKKRLRWKAGAGGRRAGLPRVRWGVGPRAPTKQMGLFQRPARPWRAWARRRRAAPVPPATARS